MAEEITGSATIILLGKVQGVGCRWFCKRIADKLNLKGTVRNLEEKQVEIYIEGTRQEIENFVEQIKIGDNLIRIEEYNIEWGPVPTEPSKSFQILH